MAKDIGQETAKVGNALASVRLDQMVLNLAKGIAWGQYDLDKVGVDVTRMMGVPGTVAIGDEDLSMLETGILPSFYQFVDTILELKMEVKMREEENSHFSAKATTSRSRTEERGGEVSSRIKVKTMFASFERSQKASWKSKSTSAYSRTVDAGYSQSYGQEMSASSLMRTKVIPKPPPEVLIERIRIELDKLRREAELEALEEPAEGEASLDPEERVAALILQKVEERILRRLDQIDEDETEGETDEDAQADDQADAGSGAG